MTMIWLSVLFLVLLAARNDSFPINFRSARHTVGVHATATTRTKASVDHSDVIIIGGGLTGMATGVALRNRGITSVTIYEQANELRKIGAALGLYPNGFAALGYIDDAVLDRIQQTASPCQRFERRDMKNELVQTTEVPTIKATAPVMYAWYLLQQALADALPESCVQLGRALHSYQILENGLVQVELEHKQQDGSTLMITKTCRILVGADGIHSRVREQMLSRCISAPSLQYSYYGKVMYRSVLDRAAVEPLLDLPEGTQISWQGSEKGKSFSLRETTQGIVTVTAAAVVDDDVNHDTAGSTNQEKKERLQHHFEEFPDVVHRIITTLSNDAIHEDFIRDISIPQQWSDTDGPVVILGDAAHAMTPHMGQGANMGLEDVCEVVHLIVPCLRSEPSNDNDNFDLGALDSYCQSRLARVKEVQERSRQNTLQSNFYDKQTASIPFERRQYSESFKDRLYNWKPPQEV